MNKKEKIVVIISLLTLLSSFMLFIAGTPNIKPLNFTEGFDFKSRPHYLEFKDSSININNSASIVDNAVVGLKYSKNRGYPILKSELENGSVKLYLPTLEKGYYNVKYNGKEYNFSIGMGGRDIPNDESSCLGKENENDCMVLYYKYKTLKEGAKVALDDLYKLTTDKPETLYLCHNWSHAIGQMTAFIYNDYKEAVSLGYDVCHFGYYHGVMESFASLFTDKELSKYFSVICDSFSYGFNRGDCVHGLGHIAWWRSGGDFPKSAEWCSKASHSMVEPGIDERGYCLTGVAMEWSNKYSSSDDLVKSEMAKGLTDPAYICNTLKESNLRNGCWEFIGPVWGGNDKNIIHMSKICESLDGYTNTMCWLGIGRDNAFRPEVSAKDSISFCQKARLTESMWNCVYNVVHSKTVSTRKPGTAKLACKMISPATSGYKSWCLSLWKNETEKIQTEGRNDLTSEKISN